MTNLIYLASPYAHRSNLIQDARVYAVSVALADYMERGLATFSPVAHVQTAKEFLPSWTHGQWLDYDLKILALCSELHVLTLPDWEQSKGIQIEVDFARAKDLPICYVGCELFNFKQRDFQGYNLWRLLNGYYN